MRIGVDLGGTKIEIAAFDERWETLVRRRVATPAGDYDATVAAIGDLVDDVESQFGKATSIGIGIPGALSRKTGLVKNANSTVLIGKPLHDDVQRRLQREVWLENDANCFALSEATGGAATSASVVFGVILGTGVGGGLVVEGRLVKGRNAIAGEWGHNPLPWPRAEELPGPQCYCGKRGCIETFLCGPRFPGSPPDVAAAAASGDREAGAIMDAYEDRLARGLATVINAIDPDAIVLGGGLSNIDRLYDNLPPLLERYVFSDAVETSVRRAAFGDSSGVRGAAMLQAVSVLSNATS